MNKQDVHKISAILLILAIFSLPFYIERNQISAISNSTFMASAVTRSDNKTPTAPAAHTIKQYISSAVTNALGNSFVGSQVK
ncbi:MAG: hypothetical protein NVSMB46_07150 [Candidatus Saccharimonadales bacterium]